MRLDGAPVSYYMNLLLSNLVQLIILIALPQHSDYHWKHLDSVHVYACCVLASLYFRMVIALERYRCGRCVTSCSLTFFMIFTIFSVLQVFFNFLLAAIQCDTNQRLGDRLCFDLGVQFWFGPSVFKVPSWTVVPGFCAPSCSRVHCVSALDPEIDKHKLISVIWRKRQNYGNASGFAG